MERLNILKRLVDLGRLRSTDAPSPRSESSSKDKLFLQKDVVAPSNKARQTVGSLGESIAAERLKAMGYRVLERNVRLTQGEIDIVARDGDVLVFVEVRTRRSMEMGLPEESITERKKQKLRQLVDSYYQARSAGETQSRIDVVVVDLDSSGKPTRVEVIKSAVDG